MIKNLFYNKNNIYITLIYMIQNKLFNIYNIILLIIFIIIIFIINLNNYMPIKKKNQNNSIKRLIPSKTVVKKNFLENFLSVQMNVWNEFRSTEKSIVFSLTCHENVDCVIDLINNIYKNFDDFNIYILISTIENIFNELKKANLNKNIIIVSVRNNDHNIWGNHDLLYQHIKNIKYLNENNIKYDYFWFVASNEYFIKKINLNFLENNIIKNYEKRNLSNKQVSNYYDDFNKNCETWDWTWYKDIKKDEHTVNIFKENNIIIYYGPHEGLVLPYELAEEIATMYDKLEIYEKATYRYYPMEEVFILSYLRSKYNIDNISVFCVQGNVYHDKSIYNNALLNDKVASIKPIRRDYNDSMRTMIRNS